MKGKGLFASVVAIAALTIGVVTVSFAADQQRSCCSYMKEANCQTASASPQSSSNPAIDNWDYNKQMTGWAAGWRR